MAKKKIKNELSISEFKSWISGIEEMSGDDWHPNKQQWDKIRAKIELLSETVEDDTTVNNSTVQSFQQYQQPIQQFVQPQQFIPQSQPSRLMVDESYVPSEARYADGTVSEFF